MFDTVILDCSERPTTRNSFRTWSTNISFVDLEEVEVGLAKATPTPKEYCLRTNSQCEVPRFKCYPRNR